MIAGRNARGKSGHHRTGCLLTASESDLKESTTENIPPLCGKVEKAR